MCSSDLLLVPARVEKSYSNLTEAEAIEMWVSAKNIAENLKKYYHTNSVQISIQDGKDAGQTVEHCHIHLIPIPEGYKSKGVDNNDRKALLLLKNDIAVAYILDYKDGSKLRKNLYQFRHLFCLCCFPHLLSWNEICIF